MKVAGASFDSIEANRKFADNEAFNFPLLCDVDRTLGLAYGATEPGSNGDARRISYLIDENGRIERAWPKVSARQHPAEVLALVGG